jgi:hypothetical protein
MSSISVSDHHPIARAFQDIASCLMDNLKKIRHYSLNAKITESLDDKDLDSYSAEKLIISNIGKIKVVKAIRDPNISTVTCFDGVFFLDGSLASIS